MVVVVGMDMEAPRTRDVAQAIGGLRVKGSMLLVTAQAEPAIVRASRNLNEVKTLPAALLNVVDIVSRRTMVITIDGIRRVEEMWGQKVVA